MVAFLNGGNSTTTISSTLVRIFGGISTNENAQQDWEMYDVWGNDTVMPPETASAILNGTMELAGMASGSENGTSGMIQGYYNATEMSFAEGLEANDTRLLGTRVGIVSAGGSIETSVPRHGIAMWRLRRMGGGGMKRDEL